jgi:Co/Zn/Cd efflux system component
MVKECCDSGCNNNQLLTPRYRKILWAALVINFTMFVIEVLSGLNAHSVSLMADAIDFFGDAANYAISLAVLSMSLMWRTRTALFKGLTIDIFGLFVFVKALLTFKLSLISEVDTGVIISLPRRKV